MAKRWVDKDRAYAAGVSPSTVRVRKMRGASGDGCYAKASKVPLLPGACSCRQHWCSKEPKVLIGATYYCEMTAAMLRSP